MHLPQSSFHFIGVGGIGMSGLAELLKTMGAKVSGSDIAQSPMTDRLASLGIQIFIGHKSENVVNPDVVVYSSAVPVHNPEMQVAKERRIPTIARAEVLAEVMRLKRGIAVAGTHGKTTTTSMTASVFVSGKLDPTIVVGGRLALIGSSTSKLGAGEWLIAEADESDGSFRKLSPEIGIITNIDNDHLEHYGSMRSLEQAFLEFAEKVPFFGHLIVFGDDQRIRELFSDYRKRVIYYGFSSQNDFVLARTEDGYSIFEGEKNLGQFKLQVPGRHNALNACAAFIAGLKAGLQLSQCLKGLSDYSGVDRRFHLRGEVNQIRVYDDYGHHPTEIKAVLDATRDEFGERRVVVVFQPHRYSRTESCWAEFLTCFELADLVFITDIYAASEKPIVGIEAIKLAENIAHPSVKFLPMDSQMVQTLKKVLIQGDIVLFMGAGDIWLKAQELVESLK